MKKIIGIGLLMICSNLASSQILIALLFGEKLNTGTLEFGITVNPGLTNISDLEGDARFGFNFGIYLNIKCSEKFYVHIDGIAKGVLGTENLAPYPAGSDTLNKLFEGGEVERHIKTFSLPVLARYRAGKKLYLDAGIQANWMLKSKDIFTAEVNENELTYTIPISDDVTMLDFGMAAGFHYKFKDDKGSMGMGIRYYQGFTDILKSYEGNQVNTAWHLVVTIPIGTGKAAAQESKGKAK